MQTLEQFAPEVEIYSIDEAFLNLAGIRRGAARPAWPPTSAARSSDGPASRSPSASARPRRWPRPPTSSPRRTRPPPASGSIIGEEARCDALARLPVGDVWGIGRRWARFLEGHGIAHRPGFQPAAGQLDTHAPERHRPAHRHRAARHALHPAGAGPAARRRGWCVSRMFGRKLTDLRAGQGSPGRLRHPRRRKAAPGQAAARHMQVFLHNSPFATAEPYLQQRHRLPASPPDQRHRRADRPCHRRPAAHLPPRPPLLQMRRHADRAHAGGRRPADLFDTRDDGPPPQADGRPRRHQPPHGPRHGLLRRFRHPPRLGSLRQHEIAGTSPPTGGR